MFYPLQVIQLGIIIYIKMWINGFTGVALYPSCSQITLTMPVKIFIGELDEWVSAAGCRSWAK